MKKILTDDIDNGCLFFKQFSGAIGKRLMTMYTQLAINTPISVTD
jgi:hypothetical protein